MDSIIRWTLGLFVRCSKFIAHKYIVRVLFDSSGLYIIHERSTLVNASLWGGAVIRT